MDLLKTSALFCIALLLGCDSNVPAYKLIERDGIMHESGSQAPLTGRSVLHHDNGQLWAIKDFKDGKMNGCSRLWQNDQKAPGRFYAGASSRPWLASHARLKTAWPCSVQRRLCRRACPEITDRPPAPTAPPPPQ